MGNSNCTPSDAGSAETQNVATPAAEDSVMPLPVATAWSSMVRRTSRAVDDPLKLTLATRSISLGIGDARLATGPEPSDEPFIAARKNNESQKAVKLANFWDLCLHCEAQALANNDGGIGNGQKPSPAKWESSHDGLEALIWDLFRLHDLDGDGFLSEGELIRINEAISEIHHGSPDSDKSFELKAKYRKLFRENLDARGKPVQYGRFRDYIFRLVEQYDKHSEAQAMIVEQWVAEAHTARVIGVSGATQAPEIRSDSGPTSIGLTKTLPAHSMARKHHSNWLLGCCLAQRPVAAPASDICVANLV